MGGEKQREAIKSLGWDDDDADRIIQGLHTSRSSVRPKNPGRSFSLVGRHGSSSPISSRSIMDIVGFLGRRCSRQSFLNDWRTDECRER
jgi:hypothetical protein